MKHRGWFTLVIRAIGIFFLGSTLSHLVAFISSIVFAVMQSRATPSTEWLSWGVGQLGVLLQAGFGFYLLFGADRLVTYCLSSVQGLCPSCGYELQGVSQPRCPECGGIVADGTDAGAPGVPVGDGAAQRMAGGQRDQSGPAGS